MTPGRKFSMRMSARAASRTKRVAPGRRLQVEDDAALAAIDRGEAGAVGAGARAHLPRRIAVGRLDLDHVRAHVA